MWHLDAYEQHCNENADELGNANISLTRSIIARQRHEEETSLQYAEDFLEKAKTANDEILECKALLNIASAHIRLFNVQKSFHFCDECLKLAERICHVKMEVESKFQKATAYLVLGENQKGYDMLTECLAFLQADPSHKYLECRVLNNISYAALRLSQKYSEFEAFNCKLREEALVFVDRSLSIFKSINIPYGIALAHLNKGLLYMESYKDYDKAIEYLNEELRIGKKLKSARLIHNGYCSMGRLYEAKGERLIAEEYYMKALETDDTPCTHLGEAENLRFSPDYLLAMMYISDKRWKGAAKCLQEVIQRCKRQGKSVKDSLLKISFNDKLTEPYQYLQYVYLEMEARKDALVIGEEGRARDFYDKLIDRNDNVVESLALPNPEDLLKISKAHNTAVLFLSQLTVVGRVYCWFIGSDGRIVDVFWVEQDHWKPLHAELCVNMYELAIRWRNSEISVEYRGVETVKDNESSVEKSLEKDVLNPVPCSKDSSCLFSNNESDQGIRGTNKTIEQPSLSSKAGTESDPIQNILDITNEIR